MKTQIHLALVVCHKDAAGNCCGNHDIIEVATKDFDEEISYDVAHVKGAEMIVEEAAKVAMVAKLAEEMKKFMKQEDEGFNPIKFSAT